MLIPEISLNINTDADAEHVRTQLQHACHSHGFFYLVDHGISITEVNSVLRRMQQFFSQPGSTKKQLERSATNPWGYYDKELTKNRQDWKEILDIGADARANVTDEGSHPFPKAKAQWPTEPPDFQTIMQSYMAQCAALSERLRILLVESLGSSSSEQLAAFGEDHSSFLRLNHYPICPNPAPADAGFTPTSGELGISPHTDAGALTLLLQSDVAGLQVYHQDQWHTITPKAGAVMVNIGDVVQVWSNDTYPAPLHRVLASATQQRYSAAYFYNPSYTDVYAPLASTGEPHYRPISWAEFRRGRTAGDYADAGEDLQIGHYKI
jgi:isopenicillin N synthase-like dioxygenase